MKHMNSGNRCSKGSRIFILVLVVFMLLLAGCGAALAARRRGASVTLIENIGTKITDTYIHTAYANQMDMPARLQIFLKCKRIIFHNHRSSIAKIS